MKNASSRFTSKKDDGHTIWQPVSGVWPQPRHQSGVTAAEAAAQSILTLVTLESNTARRDQSNQVVYFNGTRWETVSLSYNQFLY